MKLKFRFLCMLVLVIVCAASFGVMCHADTVNSVFERFADESSYTSHYYGGFGGVERVSDDTVRVLAKTNSYSKGHIGFMLKKEVIQDMVAENYATLSFKVATASYESNPVPGYVNVYASGVKGSEYQPSAYKATILGTGEDIIYPSGSVVEIDLVKLLSISDFTEGLKFILPTAAAPSCYANAPAYLLMSDFKATKRTPLDDADLQLLNKFALTSSYASHHYGTFGGVTRVSENKFRILSKTASTSNGHVGFMLRKEVIKYMTEENYTTMSFKITTEAYESNPVPGYIDVYTSGVKGAEYQPSAYKGTVLGAGDDIVYPSGSVVEIDLVKLMSIENFKEGLKFILPTAPASGSPAINPAYLVLSDFQFTKKAASESPFEQMTFEESYGNHENGEFGSVSATGNNSVKILAKEKNGTSGFTFTKSAVKSLLKFRVTEMSMTLNTSSYNDGAVPGYIVIDFPSAKDYIVNCETAASKIDGDKVYYAKGTEITINLAKLYADISAQNGLKFVLLNSDSVDSGSDSAYLSFDNICFAEKWQMQDYDLVCSNGDFYSYYKNEATWLETTKKSVKAVADAGFDYIDLSLYHIRYESDLMKDGWEDIVNELKAYGNELGIQFRQAHSPGYTTNGSDEWIDTNKRCIDVCRMLGIENIVVHPVGTSTKELFFENNARYFGYILPYAAEHNVTILCENSTGKNTGSAWFINDGASMREFIKYVQDMGYSNFHGCWDTGHANCEGSQFLEIIALGDEMHAIHFHDNTGTDTHMIPYYGNMDIDEVMSALKIIGYNGDFTLETDGSNRIGSTYTGPELAGGLDPFTTDRFEQQKIIYQLMTYILNKYDCKVLFETDKTGFVTVRAVTDIPKVFIVVASYDGKNIKNVSVTPKCLNMKNPAVSIPVNSGDKVFVLDDKMIPLANVYIAQ